MASDCCPCCTSGASAAGKESLPLICLVPRDGVGHQQRPAGPQAQSTTNVTSSNGFQLLDDDYIKKHFKLPQRALYLDPFRRPLITFPMGQEGASKNFNIAKKQKINQQILDGFLDPCEAISAPSVFPYAGQLEAQGQAKEADEEIIYILQLPDWEFKCPVHGQTIRTPRFIWHSCKKSDKKKQDGNKEDMRQGGGPMNKPKPWVLSRITDFDLLSQW